MAHFFLFFFYQTDFFYCQRAVTTRNQYMQYYKILNIKWLNFFSSLVFFCSIFKSQKETFSYYMVQT